MYYDDGGAGVALLAIFGLFWFLFAIVFYVVGSIFLMKIFDKAGVQGKWRAWVPIYNTLIFVKLGDLSPWWLLGLWGGAIVLSWIPVIGPLFGIAAFVYMILAAMRVGQKLQKEPIWLLLYIFLSLVWLGINAFDRSRWNTAIAPAPWAGNFLADKTVWGGIPVQTSAPAGGYAAPEGYAAPAGYQPPAAYQPPAPPAAPAPAAPAAYTPPPAAPPAPPAASDFAAPAAAAGVAGAAGAAAAASEPAAEEAAPAAPEAAEPVADAPADAAPAADAAAEPSIDFGDAAPPEAPKE